MYLQSHIYKNIPVSFDFITTWNKGVFLCSPCTIQLILWITFIFLNLSYLTSDLVLQYDFPVLLRCRKMSDTVLVAFVRPLSEPVRRFSSCSTDFSQQIAQVVLFLFLHVFLFSNRRIITSNPPISFPAKTNKSWGVCGWQKNWIGKG
jgi:hypothetical protein